jgi:uncharacterized protein YutE (UPF0331/DUF86 family)
MEISMLELERQRVQEVAQEYRARGYEVIIEPQPDQLPDFLQQYCPDILARGQNETVIIEVKSRMSLAKSLYLRQLAETIQQHPNWRFELVVTNPPDETPLTDEVWTLSKQDISNRLNKTDELLKANFEEAALLFAWSITEATLRLLADKEEIPLRRHDPLYLLKQLATYAVISREEYNFLLQVLKIRNAVAHGFKTDELAPELVQKLVETTRYLLEIIPDPSLVQ